MTEEGLMELFPIAAAEHWVDTLWRGIRDTAKEAVGYISSRLLKSA